MRDLRPAQLLAVSYWDDKGGAEQVTALVEELGHRDLILRHYAEDIAAIDPFEWAEVCADRMGRYRAPRLHCIPGNEMNLEAEGFDGHLGQLIEWLSRFAIHYKRLRPDDVLHLPAPWAGWVGEAEQRAIDYWRSAQGAALQYLYDEIDCHAYGAGFELWRRCAAMFGRRPWITEFNQCEMGEAARALAEGDGPQAAIYFSLRWVCYDGGEWRGDDGMSLLRYPELYQAFKEAGSSAPAAAEPPQEVAAPPPPPPSAEPLTEETALGLCYADLWHLAARGANPGDYVAENGIPAYWREHLAEMGSPVGPERLVKDDDGVKSCYQAFARGVWVWERDSGVRPVAA